jgi:rare lipoprotein A
MIVVRINDRGPYGNDRVISLSRAAADRLNTSNNTKVRIDPIIVAQDGSLSGPGMACTTVAKQTYALPARPDLSGGGNMGSMPSPSDAGQPQGDIRPISNSTLKSDDPTGAPVNSGGFLGAPTTSPQACWKVASRLRLRNRPSPHRQHQPHQQQHQPPSRHQLQRQ